MIRGIRSCEWYPILELREPYTGLLDNQNHDIPDEFVARFEKVLKEFWAVQDELVKLLEVPE